MLIKSMKNNRFWETLIMVGIVTLIFGAIMYKGISNETNNISMLKGMFVGLGCSFTTIGVVKLIQNKKTPAEKLKAIEIELKDERNVQILRMAYSISSSVATVLFSIMSFLFVALNYIVPAFIVLGAMYIQLLALFIADKYYKNKI